MKRVQLLVSLFSLSILLSTSLYADPTVLTGTIQYLEKKSAADYESDKRAYVHGNTQFMVINVIRVLSGAEVSGDIILGAEMDSSTIPGSVRIGASYRVLDPAVWQQGSMVLVILRSTSQEDQHCGPLKLRDESDVKAKGTKSEWSYADPVLAKYRSAPVFCVSGRDLFSVRGN